jgi:hypothetical protein
MASALTRSGGAEHGAHRVGVAGDLADLDLVGRVGLPP